MRLAPCSLLFGALLIQTASGQTSSARLLSLGGAGTAAARAENSGFVNPALAQRARASDRIELTAPVVSVIAADESDLRRGVERLQDSIDALQSGLGGPDEATLRSNLAGDLTAIGGAEVFGDAGIGASFVLPRGPVSLGLTWRSFVDLRGVTSIDPADFTTINNTANPLDLDQLALGPKRLVRDLPGGGERWQVEVAGIDRVLVNGETIVEQGRLSGARPGHVLRMG